MKAAFLVVALLVVAAISLFIGAGPLHESESSWAEVTGWTTALSLLAVVCVIVVAPLRALARRRRGGT